jgi:dTDP-glucose 4,6-dehydratase
MIKDKTIFITGGAGFISAHLCRRLINDNRIVIYDSFRRDSLKDSGLSNHPNLTVITGDILDYHLLKSSIPSTVHIVLHMAAVAGIDTVIQDPAHTMEVNMIGIHHLLKALHELGRIPQVERLVNFSTSEVFGVQAVRVNERTATNMQPVGEARWTYAVSKLAGEHLVHSYYQKHGLRSVTVRPFNVYGPGQVGEGAIHDFSVQAVRNEHLKIHGEGDQIRSWCYIDDMIAGVLLCLERDQAVGEVFNIGNPRGTITILGLAEKIVHLAGSSSKIVHVPKTYVDVELRIPNIEKAKSLLSYSPAVDLNQGIAATIEWYRKRQAP